MKRQHKTAAPASTAGTATGPANAAFPEGAVGIAAAGGPFSAEQRAVYTNAGSSAYISGETLNRFSGTSPSDILRGVPGVQLGDARNGGGIDVNVRGLQGQRRVSVQVDGAENTIDTYRGYAGSQQRSYLDPDLISDVTVNKGPSAAQGAIGGTVEMTTLKVEDVLRNGASYGVRVKGGIASNTTAEPRAFAATPETDRNGLFDPQAGNGSIAVAIRDQYFDIVAAYAARDQGNYFAGTKGRDSYRRYTDFGDGFVYEEDSVGKFYKEGDEVLNSSVETRSLLLKTTLRPIEGHTLDLSYRSFDSEMGEIMPSQIFRNTTETIPQWRPGVYETETFAGRYRWKPKSNSLFDVRVGGFYTTLYSDAFNNPIATAPVPPGSPINESTDPGYKFAYGAKTESQRLGFDIANTARVGTPWGGLTFDYGSAYTREETGPADDAYPPSQDDLNNNRYIRSAIREEGNAFGSVKWQPLDALTLETGLRYTTFRSRDRNRLANKQTGLGPAYRLIRYAEVDEFGVGCCASLRWYADGNGNFTPANDPRNNAGNVLIDRFGQRLLLSTYLSSYTIHSVTVDPPQQDTVVTGYSFNDPIERSDNGLSPNVAITLEVLPGTRLFAKYAEGHRMPGIFETSAGYFNATPGEVLEPEHAKNWELGFSTVQRGLLSRRDEGMFRLTYFDNTVDNFISRLERDVSKPELGVFGFSYDFVNNDSFNIKGLELQASYDAGVFFADAAVTKNFEAVTCNAKFAAYLRNIPTAQFVPGLRNTPDCIDGGFIGSFTNIQNPPALTFALTLGVRLLDERLTLGGRYLYTSEPIAKLDKEYNGTFLTPQITYEKPVELVDLFSSYKLTEDSEFSFGVDNVFDRYYIDPLAISYMPSPGRTFKTGLTAKF